MPHSLRVRLKNLQRKGELTEKDIDRIFKALEQEPCDDVVSRQAVIGELKDMYKAAERWSQDATEDDIKARADAVMATLIEQKLRVEALPSVRPQEQTKEEHIDVFEIVNAPWMFLDNCANSGYYCSKCKKKLVKDGWSETVKKINFCPNCGSEMVEPQESEDKK